MIKCVPSGWSANVHDKCHADWRTVRQYDSMTAKTLFFVKVIPPRKNSEKEARTQCFSDVCICVTQCHVEMVFFLFYLYLIKEKKEKKLGGLSLFKK